VRNGGKIFSKLSKGWFEEWQPGLLAVEDPDDTENDVGRGSFQIERIKELFASARQQISQKSENEFPDSILARILRIEEDLMTR